MGMGSSVTEKSAQKPTVHVVGGGLAGSECALQLAHLGYPVVLFEMRGQKMTEAHKTENFAELVCSNSFGSMSEGSAPAQLKWEAEKLGSYILKTAIETKIPAGQALGIDRERFSAAVTKLVNEHPLITIRRDEVKSLDDLPRPAVIATGPLTSADLSQSMQKHFGDEFLYFFDAIAPIIDTDSINTDVAWLADRYDKGTPDYYNCPFDKEQYFKFIEEIKNAKKIEPKDFEKTSFFEGCMPVEVMVDRGPHTLRFGPMKPVGLKNPKTGRDAFAIVQLRQDNKEGTAYNMVGFQTRMTYGEQIRVFRTIPGLENAEFLKLGSIHRNLYINSPKRLSTTLASKNDPGLFFAGQITGVEGYFESTCMGLFAALNVDAYCRQVSLPKPPRASAFGSLLEAITDPSRERNFQPTNINFGLLPPLEEQIRDKKLKKEKQIALAQSQFQDWLQALELPLRH